MSNRPACIKCEPLNNSNGLYTCNGCRQDFCSEHLNDHKNELRNDLEAVKNEFNRVNEEFSHSKKNPNALNLRLIREQEKNINEIRSQINEFEKAANYSERELEQWTRKLNQIRNELTTTNDPQSFQDKLKHLLTSQGYQLYIIPFCIILIACFTYSFFQPNISFIYVKGPIELFESQRVAEHNGSDNVSGSVRLNQNYSSGIHDVKLLFEKYSSTDNFISVVSLKDKQPISSLLNLFAQWIYSVFSMFDIWSFFQHAQSRHSFQCEIKSGDIITIKIDCENTKIVCCNKRTNQNYEFNLNLNNTPLPWQILITLNRHRDRIRLQ